MPIPENDNQNKGGDAAIRVGHIPVQHKHKLGEHNHKHKVGTKHKQIVDAAVEDGEQSGDQTVDGYQDIQGPQNFLLRTVGAQHFVIKVSKEKS